MSIAACDSKECFATVHALFGLPGLDGCKRQSCRDARLVGFRVFRSQKFSAMRISCDKTAQGFQSLGLTSHTSASDPAAWSLSPAPRPLHQPWNLRLGRCALSLHGVRFGPPCHILPLYVAALLLRKQLG